MCMGRIDIILPDDKEKKLRMEVGRRVGVKRGPLTDAIIEAIDAVVRGRKGEKEMSGKLILDSTLAYPAEFVRSVIRTSKSEHA
jgi:hypothetical protein